MKIHKDIKQHSVEWMILRSAKVTASSADAIVSPTGKVRTGDGPRTFLYKMLAEAWIGGPLPSVDGIFDMEQGKLREEQARPAFEFQTGLKVEEVGFLEHDTLPCGASPDGLTSDGFGLELKCPRIDTHIKYLLEGVCPTEYVIQCQFSMFVSGFRKWWFASYRPNYPMLIVLVERDEAVQEAIGEALTLFDAAFRDGFERLVKLNGGLPKATQRGNAPLPTPNQPKTEENCDVPTP